MTELKIGLLRNTVSDTLEILRESPLGAAFFDVDYFSSTVEAFSIFNHPSECYPPRVLCYMDNIISRAEFPINEFVGELAAITHFNQMHDKKKTGKLYAFHCKRRQVAAWNYKMFLFQDFGHPEYSVPVRESRNEKTKLRDY